MATVAGTEAEGYPQPNRQGGTDWPRCQTDSAERGPFTALQGSATLECPLTTKNPSPHARVLYMTPSDQKGKYHSFLTVQVESPLLLMLQPSEWIAMAIATVRPA